MTRFIMPLSRTALAAVTLIAFTAAASAKPVTLSSETNLRSAPGTKSDVVTAMPKGASIEVGECDAGWCKVTFDGKDGFAVERNLGPTPPHAATASRAQSQSDMHRLRRGYEEYFDNQGRNDQAADVPVQRRSAQSQTRTQVQTEDNYYDDDDAPVVYGAPGYVAGPPVYYAPGYYPYPRVYYGWGYGRPYRYYRRW
jgi:uncharacterized protein YgiM (DUF1202 family)